MKLNIKATNFELTALVKDQINQKFGGLDKYFNNIQQVDVELGLVRMGQQKGDIFFCEVNVSVPKKLLRFRREMDNLTKAINEAKRGIQELIREYKEKLEE